MGFDELAWGVNQSRYDLLKKINEFGTTVVLVTHNRDVVNRLGKRVVTLDDGKVVADKKTGKYRI